MPELTEGAKVLVTELQCTEEGCPPLETVIAILEGPGQTRQYKLHLLPDSLHKGCALPAS